MPRLNVIERAYELALTGRYRKPTEVIHALAREGYEGLGILVNGAHFRSAVSARIRAAEIERRNAE